MSLPTCVNMHMISDWLAMVIQRLETNGNIMD